MENGQIKKRLTAGAPQITDKQKPKSTDKETNEQRDTTKQRSQLAISGGFTTYNLCNQYNYYFVFKEVA